MPKTLKFQIIPIHSISRRLRLWFFSEIREKKIEEEIFSWKNYGISIWLQLRLNWIHQYITELSHSVFMKLNTSHRTHNTQFRHQKNCLALKMAQ